MSHDLVVTYTWEDDGIWLLCHTDGCRDAAQNLGQQPSVDAVAAAAAAHQAAQAAQAAQA